MIMFCFLFISPYATTTVLIFSFPFRFPHGLVWWNDVLMILYTYTEYFLSPGFLLPWLIRITKVWWTKSIYLYKALAYPALIPWLSKRKKKEIGNGSEPLPPKRKENKKQMTSFTTKVQLPSQGSRGENGSGSVSSAYHDEWIDVWCDELRWELQGSIDWLDWFCNSYMLHDKVIWRPEQTVWIHFVGGSF